MGNDLPLYVVLGFGACLAILGYWVAFRWIMRRFPRQGDGHRTTRVILLAGLGAVLAWGGILILSLLLVPISALGGPKPGLPWSLFIGSLLGILIAGRLRSQ